MSGYTAVKPRVAPEEREALLRDHARLVKKVAYRIVGRLPASVDVEDLISAGMIGLLSAVDRYDPTKGAFGTFAEWRIKGAILDELRTFDHLTRTQRQKASALSGVRNDLRQELGRDVTAAEVAEAAGCDVNEAERSLEAADGPGFVALDDLGIEREAVEELLTASRADPGPKSPLQLAILKETKARLAAVLGTLTEREQMILSLYYVEELNYREIGAILDLTESRICQIVRKSLKTLSKRMRE